MQMFTVKGQTCPFNIILESIMGIIDWQSHIEIKMNSRKIILNQRISKYLDISANVDQKWIIFVLGKILANLKVDNKETSVITSVFAHQN